MANEIEYKLTLDNKDLLNGLSQSEEAFKRTGTASDTTQKKMASGLGGVDQGFKKSEKSALGFWKIAGGATLGGIAANAFSTLISKAGEISKKLIEVTAQYQKYAAVLKVTLGNSALASVALDRITEFATKTPFQVGEVTEAFIKLANRGFTPTMEQMTLMGDLAASQGKSLDQLVEAMLDAQTLEFERLKEFGIRARQSGNQVALTFKGVTVEVEKSDVAIRDALLSFGQMQGVMGGMAEVSATLSGKLANLEDATEQMWRALGELLGPAIMTTVNSITALVEGINSLVRSEESLAAASTATIQTAKQEASSGQALLTRYEHLEKQVNLTAAEKNEMERIVLKLRDAFGQSVVSIDAETNALRLNKDAVRIAIQQRILLADTEASRAALQISNLKQQRAAVEQEQKIHSDHLEELKRLNQNFERGEIIATEASVATFGKRINAINESIATQTKILTDAGYSAAAADIDAMAASLENLGSTAPATTTKIAGASKANNDLANAIERLLSAQEALARQVEQSDLDRLEGIERIRRAEKLALEEIDRQQAEMAKTAKAAGKTISAETLALFTALRDNIKDSALDEIAIFIDEATEDYNRSIDEAMKKRQDIRAKELQGQLDDIRHTEEIATQRLDLIEKSGSEILSLEEYKEQQRLLIRIKAQQATLSLLEADPAMAKEVEQIKTTIEVLEHQLSKIGSAKINPIEKLFQDLASSIGWTTDQMTTFARQMGQSIGQIFAAVSAANAAHIEKSIRDNDELLDSLARRIDETKDLLDEEQRKYAEGSANTLTIKQDELNELNAKEADAMAEQRRLKKEQVKQQMRAEALQQTSSMITMTAQSIAAYAGIPFGGLAIAAGVIAGFFALFASMKARAAQLQAADTGGALSQYLNGATDKQGQRGYVVHDGDGKPVMRLGGDEYVIKSGMASKYRAELDAINNNRFEHQQVAPLYARQAEKNNKTQAKVILKKEAINYNRMAGAFREVARETLIEELRYWDRKPEYLGSPEDYIEITANTKRRIIKK